MYEKGSGIRPSHNYVDKITNILKVSRLAVQLYDNSLGIKFWSPQAVTMKVKVGNITQNAPPFAFLRSYHIVTLLDPLMNTNLNNMVDANVRNILVRGSIKIDHQLFMVRYPPKLDIYFKALAPYHSHIIAISKKIEIDQNARGKWKANELDGEVKEEYRGPKKVRTTGT